MNTNEEIFDYEATEATAKVEAPKTKNDNTTRIMVIVLAASILFGMFGAVPIGEAIGTIVGEAQAKARIGETTDLSNIDPAPSRAQYAFNLFGFDSGQNVKISITNSDDTTIYKERIKANKDGAISIAGVMDSGYKKGPAFYSVNIEDNGVETSLMLSKTDFVISKNGEASISLEYDVNVDKAVFPPIDLDNFKIEEIEVL